MDLHRKQTYFNELAGRWDQLPPAPDAPEKLARFAARCLDDSGMRVLDVGCGTGVLLKYLQTLPTPPEMVVELDLAEEMLRENRKKYAGRDAACVCAEARLLPFRQAFDCVICFNALPHLVPLEQVLRRMLDCLRPGGRLTIGHLMASAELNRFHSEIGGAVGEDRLPLAGDLAALLAGLGAEVGACEESPGWYLVQASRR